MSTFLVSAALLVCNVVVRSPVDPKIHRAFRDIRLMQLQLHQQQASHSQMTDEEIVAKRPHPLKDPWGQW